MTLGEKLKSLRESKGLTQVEFAEALGLKGHSGEVTVYNWEHNRQKPTLKIMRELSRVLSMHIEEILSDVEL